MTDTPHQDLPGQAKPAAFADNKPQVAHGRELFRVEGLPVQQNTMYRSVEAALHCPRGDVVLVQDNQSGLISNRAFDPSLLTYDQDYQNEQGVSRYFKQHLEAVADILQPHAVGKDLLEIGCGKGLFLELLHQRGLTGHRVARAPFTGADVLLHEGFDLKVSGCHQFDSNPVDTSCIDKQ